MPPANAAKRQRGLDAYNQYVAPTLPDWASTWKDKRKAAIGNRMSSGKGFGGRMARFAAMRAMTPEYSQPETALRAHEQANLGDVTAGTFEGEDPSLGALSTYNKTNLESGGLDSSPALSALSRYTRERLGTGLTAEESASIRGQQIEASDAAANEAARTTANTMAASGMDPRAAAPAMGRINRQREQGRTDAERAVTDAGLKRKGEIEQLAGTAGGEEVQRLGDTERLGAETANMSLSRLGAIESGNKNLADLSEQRREYDVGFTESRRQARKNRDILDRLRRAAEPTGLDKANAIIGGVRGGLGA